MEVREAFFIRNRLFLFCKHMAKLELVLWFSGKSVIWWWSVIGVISIHVLPYIKWVIVIEKTWALSENNLLMPMNLVCRKAWEHVFVSLILPVSGVNSPAGTEVSLWPWQAGRIHPPALLGKLQLQHKISAPAAVTKDQTQPSPVMHEGRGAKAPCDSRFWLYGS